MRIPLDGTDVIFPFGRIYPEQYDFIQRTHQVLKEGGHCLLEMPNGTAVCMISLCLALKRKLVYAINPIPKLKRLAEEIDLCYQAYQKEKDGDVKMEDGDVKMEDANHTTTNGSSSFLTLCLSSHDQELLHESYHNKPPSTTTKRMISGIYENLQQLIEANKKHNWYPSIHELIQSAMEQANILVVQYTYLLDPKVSKMMMSANLFSSSSLADAADAISSNGDDTAVSSSNNNKNGSDTVVVFDQAHNIDSICMNILSVTIHSTCLDQATRSLGRLSAEITRRKTNNGNNGGIPPLQEEYQSLVDTPINHGVFYTKDQGGLSTNQIEDWEPVPGNIRRAEHFIGFLRKIIEYYKVQFRWLTNSGRSKKNAANKNGTKTNGSDSTDSATDHRKETPLSFLHRLTNSTGLEAKALRFTYARLVSLLRTLQISSFPLLDPKSFTSILAVADLTSLLANHVTDHNSKFTIVTELSHVLDRDTLGNEDGGGEDDPHKNAGGSQVGDKVPTLQFVCLDASLALKPVLERFRSVIMTSTAMSPLDFYPKILQFTPTLIHSFPLSFSQNCVYPTIIARGSDQIAMSTKTSDRASLSVVRNYGSLLVELCSIIPDGVVAYFPSYSYMESLLQEWDAMGILRELTKYKLVFLEEVYDLHQTTLTLDNYRLACDNGRGGIFFAIARGKVSESLNLDHHYGRATIVFGMPILYSKSQVVQARVDYCQTYLEIPSADYWNFDAMRQASKCLANTLRSPLTDYSILVLADIRYNHKEKRSKLPSWIEHLLPGESMSTDHAVQQIKSVLRHMGQPIPQPIVQNILLTRENVMKNNNCPAPVTASSSAMIVDSIKSEGP